MPALPTINSPDHYSFLQPIAMAEKSSPQPSQQTIIVTPGSDITIHVEENPEVKGITVQETEPPSQTSPTYVTKATKQTSVWDTRVRVPTSRSKKTTKVSTTRAKKTNMSFTTIYASRSGFSATPATSLSLSQTMSIDQTSSPNFEPMRRAQIQRATPTPVFMAGNDVHLLEGQISTIAFYVLMAVLVVGLLFALKVALITNYPWLSFKSGSRALVKYFKHDGHKKSSITDNQDRTINSVPLVRQNTFARSHSDLRVPPNIDTSIPYTSGIISFQGPNPLATTSSLAYSTPNATPQEATFSSTLRHRQTIPPSLTIEPPSPSPSTIATTTTTGPDLESQDAPPTPALAYFRPTPSRNSSQEPAPGNKFQPQRTSSSGWIAGAVDKVAEGFVKFTRDKGGDEGLLLPLDRASKVGRF